MTILETTSELEAVNAILATIGEAPVTSLDPELLADDAATAHAHLKASLRRTLARGWTFNTERNITIEPDVNGRIFVGADAVRVVVANNPKIVVRHGGVGARLYDMEFRTDVFESAQSGLSIIRLLDFDVCPEAMRDYCAIAAGRRFQQKIMGDQVKHRIEANDELRAWADLLNHEGAVAQWNVVLHSRTVQRIKGVRS
ncbi:MAG: hypothetical protein ACXWDH_06370 [Aeromicrobium sp.]